MTQGVASIRRSPRHELYPSRGFPSYKGGRRRRPGEGDEFRGCQADGSGGATATPSAAKWKWLIALIRRFARHLLPPAEKDFKELRDAAHDATVPCRSGRQPSAFG